jgi:uncharacterized membrane protein
MPLDALLLVLLSAVMHTGWNILVKQAQNRQVFTWWALLAGATVFIPFILISTSLPGALWPYVIVSALAEAAYFVALLRAYQYGDFSLVYPIARGAAPAMLAAWAIIFLDERPQPGGWIGLSLLLVGLVLVGGGRVWLHRSRSIFRTPGLGAALLVALFISIYSAIDAAGVRLVSPIVYGILVLGLGAVFTAPVVFIRYGYRAVLSVARTHWLRILSVAALMMLTYIIVLQAYAIARASYVGALREVSVVFAAWVGWRWMGESFGAVRMTGGLLIFAGIVLIAVAG